MRKLLLLALSLVFILAACKAKTNEPNAQAPSNGEAAVENSEESQQAGALNQKIIQISMEVMQLMKDALEKDDYKALNEKIDALKEENADDPAEILFRYIRDNPGVRTGMLAEKLSISRRTAERHLQALKRDGKVEFRGAPRNGGYYPK